MIYAIILFVITYILMLTLGKYRTYIALISAALFIISGMLPLNKIFGSIDFNVLLMIAGTMGLVQLFIDSKMPALLADLVMEKVPNVQMAAVALALFAGIISAFVDNVATVLMVAPIALEICKKLKTNPVPFIIAIAVSSNLQGAATLVGDTTAIMLGSYANMNFMDFFFYKGKPGIFFAVELGALASALILAWLFRKEKQPIPKNTTRTVVTDYVPTVLLAGMIVLLIAASFIPNKPDITNGLICVGLLIAGIIYTAIKTSDKKLIGRMLKAVDLETIGLLFGLFLVIGGISHMGVIDAVAALLAKLGGGNVFLLYTVIVWASVLFSAFIDNIPYVATMLPVISGLAANLGIDPTLLYFGLLSGATLGGNCTPIGASANIAGIGILRKAGYEVKTKDFVRIGIPFTLAAVIPAYIYFWLLYS
ncbi:MAG TPA: SLC13 family permease [Clostridia bacterium]|jgi:Na+/H+ antiporter NhaD/arsenite permease-like protein|nr:arsenic transporter [Clostridiaceae bacterium]HOM34368.1 SLC13 family permease [Clostridia bacterium]HOT70558.1 SLC13 family permease [Clostridia bacterium]HQG00151.1 SLC13 family permease [Clostridia bacterium]HQH66274.1 SLC13 family permease [Clostridia bacterium]